MRGRPPGSESSDALRQYGASPEGGCASVRGQPLWLSRCLGVSSTAAGESSRAPSSSAWCAPVTGEVTEDCREAVASHRIAPLANADHTAANFNLKFANFNLKFANFVKFEFEFEFVCEPPKLEVCKLEVCKLEVWEFPNSNLKFEFVRQPPKLKQTQT